MSPGAKEVRQSQLDQLRIELVDLAFTLECRGRLDAADLALSVAARIAELGGEPIRPASPRSLRE